MIVNLGEKLNTAFIINHQIFKNGIYLFFPFHILISTLECYCGNSHIIQESSLIFTFQAYLKILKFVCNIGFYFDPFIEKPLIIKWVGNSILIGGELQLIRPN